jgi:hypothetical protein
MEINYFQLILNWNQFSNGLVRQLIIWKTLHFKALINMNYEYGFLK